MLIIKRIICFTPWIIVLKVVTAKFDSKSVNVELETSLQFDPARDGNHSIKEIKTFINRLQNLLIPIKELLYPNQYKMSDVIENVALKVNDYDDKEFGKISGTLVKEVDDHINNNKHLSVFLGDRYRDLIKYIQDNPTFIRVQTRKSNSKHLKAIKDLLTKLDKYYDDNDVNKLKTIANKLEQVPKRNDNVKKLVKDALNVLVFDKYKKLNSTAKSQLFAEILSIQRNLKIKLNNKNYETTILSEKDTSRENDSKSELKGNSKDTQKHKGIQSLEDESTKHDNSTNDIILNKNIEILIENDDLKSE